MMDAKAIRRLATQAGEAERGNGRTYDPTTLAELIPDWFAEELQHVPEDQHTEAVYAGIAGFMEGWGHCYICLRDLASEERVPLRSVVTCRPCFEIEVRGVRR